MDMNEPSLYKLAKEYIPFEHVTIRVGLEPLQDAVSIAAYIQHNASVTLDGVLLTGPDALKRLDTYLREVRARLVETLRYTASMIESGGIQ